MRGLGFIGTPSLPFYQGLAQVSFGSCYRDYFADIKLLRKVNQEYG